MKKIITFTVIIFTFCQNLSAQENGVYKERNHVLSLFVSPAFKHGIGIDYKYILPITENTRLDFSLHASSVPLMLIRINDFSEASLITRYTWTKEIHKFTFYGGVSTKISNHLYINHTVIDEYGNEITHLPKSEPYNFGVNFGFAGGIEWHMTKRLSLSSEWNVPLFGYYTNSLYAPSGYLIELVIPGIYFNWYL